MITVVRNTEGRITEVTNEYRLGGENRNDWPSFAVAQEVAAEVTAFTGKLHVATDKPNTRPRFDIVCVPAVGDDVSYSFNGDTYPCGKVKSVSKSLRLITTTEGQKFYRVDTTGCWRMGGTWSLVQGHRETRNPHF